MGESVVMAEQKVIWVDGTYQEIDDYLKETGTKRIFLVCGKSIQYLNIKAYFEDLEQRLNVKVIYFSDFQPNPQYQAVVQGVERFHSEHCDMIVAVGGGSAMDVAKCIKLYSNMDAMQNYLYQKIVPNNIPLLVVPTTAGTGSEATRYAVIYYDGEKQSVTDYSCIPDAVVFDPTVLSVLPEYHKKATMLDAFCHALESLWSVNSSEESKAFAKEAIYLILENKSAYLGNETDGNAKMLCAAFLAGKAINITQTTAGHAMCYKLTSLYGIAHGHAAALCVVQLWPYMMTHTDRCIDPRGKTYLDSVFQEIAVTMGCSEPCEAYEMFLELLKQLNLPALKNVEDTDVEILQSSVNPVRLKNNPVMLDKDTLKNLYERILEK